MRRLLLADSREELLATLEVILKHWGYRVLALSRPEDIFQSLEASPPGLLILGESLLNSPHEPLNRALQYLLQSQPESIILLKNGGEPNATNVTRLVAPVDLFLLFEQVQARLERYPRRNLRLEVNLPGMVCQGEVSNLAEIVSISARGLFIKTTFRLGTEDHLRIVLPLLGMHKELDLEARVLYRMEPNATNNYQQGVGIEFSNLTEEEQGILEDYLEKRFLEEVSESLRGADLDPAQLQLHSEELLRIIKLPE